MGLTAAQVNELMQSEGVRQPAAGLTEGLARDLGATGKRDWGHLFAAVAYAVGLGYAGYGSPDAGLTRVDDDRSEIGQEIRKTTNQVMQTCGIDGWYWGDLIDGTLRTAYKLGAQNRTA